MATQSLITTSILALAACATLLGVVACDEPKANEKDSKVAKTEKVVIVGKTFYLEPVTEDETRFKGLSGRTEIKADGGMLFAFKEPLDLNFVMRDCPIPIDIIYLDGAGRVTATHKMLAEAPRGEGETENKPRANFPNDPKWTWSNEKYEARLKKYNSRHPAQFALELKGNTLDSLKVKEGDKVTFDIVGLKTRAK